MKDGRMLLALLGGLLGLWSSWTAPGRVLAQSVPAATALESFPILSRFELPRDYGYFIGDEIPLTLVIETGKDVVLDLVNLPQPGNKHGLFEIRALHLTSTTRPDATKVYRAAYTLQYFGPTPMTLPFGPLEILYALPPPTPGLTPHYTYQHLLTQPAILHLARIGPLRTAQMATFKGPWDDPRQGLAWALFSLGIALILPAIGRWGWAWYRTWQRRHGLAARSSTAAEQTLQRLQQEATDLFRPLQKPTPPMGIRLGHIIRTYLQTAHRVPAFTLTTSELAAHLNGAPYTGELLEVLEQCEALKCQPVAVTPPAAERELWWHTVTLFETLQKDGAP
jgi:hypothetical protein